MCVPEEDLEINPKEQQEVEIRKACETFHTSSPTLRMNVNGIYSLLLKFQFHPRHHKSVWGAHS